MKVRNYTKKDSSVFNVNQLAKLENLFHLKQWVIDTGNELSTFEKSGLAADWLPQFGSHYAFVCPKGESAVNRQSG